MSSDPQRALKVLRDISQNLPMQTRFVGDIFFHFCGFRFLFVDYLLVIFNPRSLVKTKVKEEMRKEIKLNQKVSSLKKFFSSLWQYTFIFTCSCLHQGFLNDSVRPTKLSKNSLQKSSATVFYVCIASNLKTIHFLSMVTCTNSNQRDIPKLVLVSHAATFLHVMCR